MVGGRYLRSTFLPLLLLGATFVTSVSSAITPHLELSFFFDWNPEGQPYPVPITQQCETLRIKWSRGSALGPNPVPPYFLQVYTSIHTVPIIIPAGSRLNFDWAVPFAPGTQYQICMFDKNGNTGGCQDTYTVIPSLSAEPLTCANVTLPPQLEVEGIVNNGPISRYGWIEQCTDIQVRPVGGTPPYIFTVAPSLHPPYNITGMGAMNWTVSLTWASQFFISVSDSSGKMWANGLLHSAGPSDPARSECLVADPNLLARGKVQPAVAVGAGFGGLGVGLLAGAISMFMIMRARMKYWIGIPGETQSDESAYTRSPQSRAKNTLVNPFIVNTETGQHNTPLGTQIKGLDLSAASPSQSQGAVYVLHHDSNAPPVTIFHEQGQEIVELPPRYPEESRMQSSIGGRVERYSNALSDSELMGTTIASSDGLPSIHQNRRPALVRKPSRERPLIPPRSSL